FDAFEQPVQECVSFAAVAGEPRRAAVKDAVTDRGRIGIAGMDKFERYRMRRIRRNVDASDPGNPDSAPDIPAFGQNMIFEQAGGNSEILGTGKKEPLGAHLLRVEAFK